MKRRRMRILIASASALVLVLIVCYVLFQISKSRTFQFFGGLTSRVQTDEKIVALTFDDAPTTFTDEVLATLAEKKVKATFYAIGKELENNPEQGKHIVEQGHELGNHSYTHPRFYFKSPSFIKHEIEETNRLIRRAGYAGEITFRPPNGKKLIGLPWYLNQQHMRTIMWDVEPDTYVTGTTTEAKTEFLVRYTLDHTRPGSIILMHPFCDSCQADRNAIPGIIDGLRAQGYEFLTISRLLK